MSISAATKQAGTTVTRPRKAWILLAVSLGQFLIQLDLTIVNVALPAIGRDLGTSVSGLQWAPCSPPCSSQAGHGPPTRLILNHGMIVKGL